MDKDKKYTLTCTGEQMMVICSAVEDWHRFLSGQCEMANATAMCERMHDVQDILNRDVRPFIVPELAYNRGAAYDWAGNGCPNKYQKRMIAMSLIMIVEAFSFLAAVGIQQGGVQIEQHMLRHMNGIDDLSHFFRNGIQL